MIIILVFLLLLLVVVPFVSGFFAYSSQWLLYPSMYLNMYLVYMAILGNKTKMWFHKQTSK